MASLVGYAVNKDAIHLDKLYLEWLSYQPSCIDGSWNQYDEAGDGRNIPCHVRRVNRGAGTGKKPLFSAVPMTHEQHMQEATLRTPEWFEEQADLHLIRFLRWWSCK